MGLGADEYSITNIGWRKAVGATKGTPGSVASARTSTQCMHTVRWGAECRQMRRAFTSIRRGSAVLSMLFWQISLFHLSLWTLVGSQELPRNGDGVTGHSLHPPYFNLAEGAQIQATATCGEEEGNGGSIEDLYCKLVGGPVLGDPSQTIQGQHCDICTTALGDKAHPITNAIDGTERWWQSPPLSRGLRYNEVNITLDLGQLFHVAYVLIKFANSPRPDLWVLERSTDFGETYTPWQYFASSKRDCIERFGPMTIDRISRDDSVICTTEYSRIVPLENGELVVSLVNGRPGAMNFSYNRDLQEFTKATNIRLCFLRTNTLLGHLMGKTQRDPTVTRRYYYSIKDISIGGRCVCNGHADMCDAKDPSNPYGLQCDCKHNTCGTSCDRCCPGYNQLPWKPATTYSANECEACNCNGHAYDCYYDPEVDLRKASMNRHGRYEGGGVCIECQHHTTGVNCELCVPGYYKLPNLPINSPSICARCNCDSQFTDGTCEDLTGRCYCKPNYTGENCHMCAGGYHGFPDCYPVIYPGGEGTLPAGAIVNCECNVTGTVDNACRRDAVLRRCVCKPNFQGISCDSCAPGYYGPNCQACQCQGPGVFDGTCDLESGKCMCHAGFEGSACTQCAPGYFNYPLCQLCSCSVVGTFPERCDAAGRCLCRPEFDGPRCDQCRAGFHSYPSCQACSCDRLGSVDNTCSPAGHCRCRPNYAGATCGQCAPGYYGYPSCSACHCSIEGSHSSVCDQTTGQCRCLPGVVGQRCDTCVPGAYGYPHCRVGSCHPVGSISLDTSSSLQGSCECRQNVEGAVCDQCKALYWNLSPDNPHGCSNCNCNTEGTVAGVAECHQGNGQCFCKPNVCGQTCSVCERGYFNLQNGSYFGCQGCHCDVGGSLGMTCSERTGVCQCRKNVEGPKCNQPRKDYYFPDLHHMKFEIEDGTTPDGRAVRFGYNPLEFDGFSWRGYAQMSSIQNKVQVTVPVDGDTLFRFILRYVNAQSTTLYGKVTAYLARKKGTEQSKQITFTPASDPAFVTVPQNSFGDPFVLNPGIWSVVIEAEGVLLDYLVLLPSAYYEAPVLQLKALEPCTYNPQPERAGHNCLLYRYLSLDNFPSSHGSSGMCRFDNSLPRPCPVTQVTQYHPPTAVCSGNEINVQVTVSVSRPGGYVLLVEYINEDEAMQNMDVVVNTPGTDSQLGKVLIYKCKFSFPCRSAVIDHQNRVKVFELSTEADIQLIADRANFFLHKVYLIPSKQFSMEYAEPKVHCISTHGVFSTNSSSCVPSRFKKPPLSILLKEGYAVSIPSSQPLIYGSRVTPVEQVNGLPEPPVRPPSAVDPSDLIHLRSQENVVVYNSHVKTLGRYAFILHYYQPNHPTFPVEVLINGGRVWQGYANATFCPHGYGCRSLVISESQVILDVTDNDLSVSIRVPEGKTIWLDYVLVVPAETYNSSCLTEEHLDKSYDFISNCGANSFYINQVTSSSFCRDFAVSLSAYYNNGAKPCNCHEVGAVGSSCAPFGGQCTCKPNVIGRDCSRCATGYWGFPNCRPCECGTRLCDEITGDCICPPLTVQPECTICQPQTFGCHPLVGCEECNCSNVGVQDLTDPGCDTESGQCSCKPYVIGRRCDTCAPGYYGYPNCRHCDCNEGGTTAGICDPVTGQCHCKENVEGHRCDRCRLGTFYLDPANPKGCTSCFCFGATDRCHSSQKFRKEHEDLTGWILVSGDRQELPPPEVLGGGLQVDVRDIPDVTLELYWQAPPSYLGDRVSSYGGHLQYQLSTVLERGDNLILPVESRPDIILKGNQMTVVYREKIYSGPGEVHQGHAKLVEDSFRHSQTHNPVTREELMMVLANLEALHIRVLYSQNSKYVMLSRPVLEYASETTVGTAAKNVEICLCPANYRGDSCQECAPGFYRDTKGLFLGKCVPCNCNGHSDQCLPSSGICVNCQHNTAGDRCERCRSGFVGNVTEGQPLTCLGCPCPLQTASNNFAMGCVERGDATQCLCKPGYAGAHCERCAPGYYGNPMVIGSSCKPCNCNGNTDSNMLFSECDSLTGVCIGCMHNTAGPHCEQCAPGYFGDAVVKKDCKKCNCSPCGTESCDHRTGACRCKVGVTGPRCDRCEDGYYGYDSCTGCQHCTCGVAALNPVCHSQTGQCSCPTGVTGQSCQQCAPGFWNYGPRGCTRCNCRTGSCNPLTGECTCADGVSGPQCDTCSQENHIPIVIGAGNVNCEPCDSCVLVLLEDLKKNEASFTDIRNQLGNLNASSVAWTRLRGLNSSITSTNTQLQQYQQMIEKVRNSVEELNTHNQHLNVTLDTLQTKAETTHTEAKQVSEITKETRKSGEDLLIHIQGILRNISDLVKQLNSTTDSDSPATTATSEEMRQKLAEAVRLLAKMRARSFDIQNGVADTEMKEAHKLLERVKNELTKHWDENTKLSVLIRDHLTKFVSKLMDLRDALNEAVNNTRTANDLSNINEIGLEKQKQKVKDLQNEYQKVQDSLKMAEDALLQVSDLLQMIDNLKDEFEKLAANLDGARGRLLEKVSTFSPAISKIPLVEQAEEHAKLLDQLAQNLSSIIRDTNQNGFIQRAINASNAYASIIEAVKNAEKAANEAGVAADSALKNATSANLRSISERMKNKSIELEESASQAHRNLNNNLKPVLNKTKENLKEAQKKHRQLLQDLRNAQSQLSIERGNISETIQKAKDTASEANTTATRLQDGLNDMRKNLEKWNGTYGDISSEDLNSALEEAKKSAGTLATTIPVLLDKLTSLENKKNQSMNLSENILRVRQLISQARNAASKVKVSMKFNGHSGVQVRLPTRPQDLSAYTALKLYIRAPEVSRENQQAASGYFILYLGNKDASGDYIGIIMKEQKLKWVYKLGEEEAATLDIDAEIGTEFATIRVERILQYGQMSVTVQKSDRQLETKGTVIAKGQLGLLNVDPQKMIFYVGGYPSEFSPPGELNLPGYEGCIETDTLNEEVISLYNFEKVFDVDNDRDRPCARPKSSGDPWSSDASYFDGSGYAEIGLTANFAVTNRFEQEVRIVSYNGIIFFIENEGKFVCLAVKDGKLVLYYDTGNGLQIVSNITSTASPTSQEIGGAVTKLIQVILQYQSNKFKIYIRMDRKAVYSVNIDGDGPKADKYYLGGIRPDKFPNSLKEIFPTGGSIRGCMRVIKALDKYIDLKRENTTGVSYGCSSELLISRFVRFTGDGYIKLEPESLPGLQDNFHFGFGFRSAQNNGLMFQYKGDGTCDVSLKNGKISMKFQDEEIESSNTFSDDISHYATFYSNNGLVTFYVDDKLEKQTRVRSGAAQLSTPVDKGQVYLGGLPDASQDTSLVGCVSNVFLRRTGTSVPQVVMDLQQNVGNVNVSMSCPSEQQPQQMRALQKKSRRKMKSAPKLTIKGRRHHVEKSCRLPQYPKVVPGAFHFGQSPKSRFEYDSLPATFQNQFHFSMEVRLESPSGLLLYVSNDQESSFLALYVFNGYLVFLVHIQGEKLRTKSKEKYSDGRWHTVFFSRVNNKIQLLIDGLKIQSSTLPQVGYLKVQTPMYVGGVPAEKANKNIPSAALNSFKGCMKNLQLDGKLVEPPSRTYKVEPCFVGALEEGIFFSAEGGYHTLDNTVTIEQDFELLLEVRPRSQTGILFHAGAKKEQYLILYMDNGKVIVKVNRGAGEYAVAVTPNESMCNGLWHKIAVIKRHNVIQVDVDTERNHTVGPSQTYPIVSKEMVYVGGVPDKLDIVPWSSPQTYVGCIRKVVINQMPVNFSSMGSSHGTVRLNGCPVM
ncbi:laminin subunit alpha-5 [Protopterus annectens]|uniref:laminin subunit alpha-5 n=1 Tax=Protopterus annectens TaxID=7888 RepID=UPI001CFB7856|nr:laminin subunit alpha-5 [Protopterus annectens]